MRSGSRDLRRFWLLEPGLAFLNHGSFGACPIPVLEAQQRWRDRMERQPVGFFARELEGLMDAARAAAAEFIGAEPEDIAPVSNVTEGVNAVLRSYPLSPGDHLLTTNHAYNACRNALEFVAARSGARVIVADLPFPIVSADGIVETILDRVTSRTRLALIDHVTSPTGLVLPIDQLAPELEARGVDLLVDGAHAPGMLDLDVASLGATYYTGNFHKWVCAPKGAGFLWVRRHRQAEVRPVCVSHGANMTRSDRSRFWLEFDWTGTADPTAWLCVPDAIAFVGGLLPGGWPALRAANRDKVLAGRAIVCRALGIDEPAPGEMIGSLAALPLPDGSPDPPSSPLYADPLQAQLLAEHGVEVPIVPWPAPPRRLARLSAHVYNTIEEYEQLAEALVDGFG